MAPHKTQARRSVPSPAGEQVADLQAQVERLSLANRNLDEFATVVAHELKEPLSGIRAYCEILLEYYEDQFDAGGRLRLGALVEMCDRLAGSIDTLLTYCRIGGLPHGEVEVDLNAVVEEALQTLRPRIEARDAEVRGAERLPSVRGDAVLIGRLLVNLISNGLKFNRSRRPRVEIGCLSGHPPTVYVRDNGIGIPKKHHQDVFAIFRRLHARSQYEGSGAGLTIARKIVESHGGRIWLESKPGRGTTFFFTLGPTPSDTPPDKPPHWLASPARRPHPI